MSNIIMDHEHDGRALSQPALTQIGRWLLTVLVIFLGLSGPSLGYIKALEPSAD